MDFGQVSVSWKAPTGCSSIGAASTMQTVTMKISPSISSTTHNRSLLYMIIMDLSLTVCVFQLAGRALRHAANLARRDAEDLCKQVFCRRRLNSMPTSLNSLLEPSAVWSLRIQCGIVPGPSPPRSSSAAPSLCRILARPRSCSESHWLGESETRTLARPCTRCVRLRLSQRVSPALSLSLSQSPCYSD